MRATRWMVIVVVVLATATVASAEMLISLPMLEGAGGTTANLGSLGGDATIEDGLTWQVGGGPGSHNAISYGTTHDHTTYPDGILLPPAVVGTALDNLGNYTVTLWAKLNVDQQGKDGKMHSFWGLKSGSGGAADLWINQDDRRFDYRDASTDRRTPSGSWSNNAGTWQFVAFSLDGTSGSSGTTATARFYTGTELSVAALVATYDNVRDDTSVNAERFAVGAALPSWQVHNLPGDFADVRLYDPTLELAQIEHIRWQATVPEPATLSLLALGGLALLRRRRRS